MPATKPAARLAIESPHQREHDRSRDALLRHPRTLRDHIRELRDAREAETVTRLHTGGVEWDDAGGSALGTPRWTVAFRSYITGPDCGTDLDGEWRWPLRSSLFRLSVSRSGEDRLAAAFVWLLMHHGYDVKEAWAHQCGPFADPLIADVAETWALAAMTRWWGRYVEQPQGRMLA